MNDNILSFLQESLRIKRMVRSGWIFSGVPLSSVESVADHSYMVTLLALIIGLDEQQKGSKIDLEKLLIMALIHDLSESVSQDIDRGVGKFAPNTFRDFKDELDENALNFLLEKLPLKSTTKLQEIFQEFKKGKTIESKLVAEIDRLDTILQLKEYRNSGVHADNFKLFYENFNQEKDKYQFTLIRELATKLLEEED